MGRAVNFTMSTCQADKPTFITFIHKQIYLKAAILRISGLIGRFFQNFDFHDLKEEVCLIRTILKIGLIGSHSLARFNPNGLKDYKFPKEYTGGGV